MRKRISINISLVIQGVFSFACIADVVLCMIYRQAFDTDFGIRCAYIALDLTGFILLFLLISLPTSLVLNIGALLRNNKTQRNRLLWILWAVLSPIIYLLFWITSLCFFVDSTGGV